MKNMIIKITILALFILAIMSINVYAVDVTLDEIVTSFNNCSTVQEYATNGSTWVAANSGTGITITVTTDTTTKTFEYTLEDSILSTSFSGDDAATGLIVNVILTDSIGQLHGYADKEMFPTLNSKQISEYTLENQGFEIKEITEGSYQVKIDISQKIPLIDFSDVYIEVADLDGLKEFVSGDGYAEITKGNLWFHKEGSNGENTVLVAEKPDLTENAYKSMLSIIEVMFNSDEVSKYFKENYTAISDGDKAFTGFKIEINPTKTDEEGQLLSAVSESKFVRITINKNEVLKVLNMAGDVVEPTTPAAENTVENTITNTVANKVDNTISKESKIPQTGGESFIHTIVKYGIILMSLILIGMIINDTKKK